MKDCEEVEGDAPVRLNVEKVWLFLMTARKDWRQLKKHKETYTGKRYSVGIFPCTGSARRTYVYSDWEGTKVKSATAIEVTSAAQKPTARFVQSVRYG